MQRRDLAPAVTSPSMPTPISTAVPVARHSRPPAGCMTTGPFCIAIKVDCERCPIKTRCCPNTPQHQIPRDVNEEARDYARSLVDTEAYDQSRRKRKKVEMLFAHLTRHLGSERMRLRGLSGAQDEFLLAATVHESETARQASPPYRRQ